jgi:hypothetical protein
VVEDVEVIAALDIAKCLHDAISGMDKAAEQGNAVRQVELSDCLIIWGEAKLSLTVLPSSGC